MTIVDAHLYQYRLPLTDALAVGGRTLTERRGLLLRLDEAGGATGWGEAAPLPEFSDEGLETAVSHSRRVARDLLDGSLPASDVDDVLRAVPGDDAPPAVRFAAESAVVELLADVRDHDVVRALGGEAEVVSMNALIPDATDDLEAEAGRTRERGYRAVKLKVGRRSVEADAARVQTLHTALGARPSGWPRPSSLRAALGARPSKWPRPSSLRTALGAERPDGHQSEMKGDVALRLDANRAWTIEEADAFAEALGNVPIDYIEEPLRDPTGLADFVDATGLPVALDETTREVAPAALPDDLPLRAVVLKPTLLGGLSAARRWAGWAERRGAVPVVSASYESGVGLRMLAALAASLSDAPAGLSTYTRLETDVLRPRLPLAGAEASIEQLYSATVDRSLLEPVGSVQ